MPQRRWIVEIDGEVREYIIGGELAEEMRLRDHIIQRQAAELEQQRKRTAKEIIRDYYLARETEKSLKFRDYLRRIGAAQRENYFRKVKVAYDKAKRKGRRGNTRKPRKASDSDK